MDKRVVIAAGLSVLILVLWNAFLAPPPPKRVAPPELPAGEQRVEGERPFEGESTPAETAPQAVPSRPLESEPVEADSVELMTFANDVFAVDLTNAGGHALSWKLLGDYQTSEGQVLELLPQFVGKESRFFQVDMDDAELADRINAARYQVERQTVSAAHGLPAGQRYLFRWADGRGVEVAKSLTFREGASWLVDVELEVRDRGRKLPARLILGPGFGAQDPGSTSTYYYSNQLVWKVAGGDVDRLKQRKVAQQPGILPPGFSWVGLEDQYFTAILIPAEPTAEGRWQLSELTIKPELQKKPEGAVNHPVLSVSLPDGRASVYIGPKNYTLLRDLGSSMEEVVWFASNRYLAWIARFIFFMLRWFHSNTIGNWGMAIILSTFVVRLILLPVNQYSMVSMKKTQMQMAKLQPKIKAIKNKHKKKDSETRAKVNQEMMDLYKREGVNPMGGLSGCLPMLAQLPILIGFYNMLTVAVELRGAPFFGWIQDLSRPDPFYVTPILMGVTMFVQQRMAMTKVKDPTQAQQQKIMMFMPFMFLVICLRMPAGMVLYWFINNILGIGQQWLVNRHTSRLETATQKA